MGCVNLCMQPKTLSRTHRCRPSSSPRKRIRPWLPAFAAATASPCILAFPISGGAPPPSHHPPHHATATAPPFGADHTSAKAGLTGILTAIFSSARRAGGSPPHGRRYNAGAPTGRRLDRRRLAGRRSSSSSSSGEVLRIAVPRKTGFQAFVDVRITRTPRDRTSPDTASTSSTPPWPEYGLAGSMCSTPLTDRMI